MTTRTAPGTVSGIETRQWRDGDLALLRDAESCFSPAALSSRFLSGTKRFPSAYLRRLNHGPEPDRGWLGQVALVEGWLVGLAECVWFPRGDSRPAEVGVLVADRWQRRGIGGRLIEDLMRRCLATGTTSVTAESRADNSAVDALARHRWDRTGPGRWRVSSSVDRGLRHIDVSFRPE